MNSYLLQRFLVLQLWLGGKGWPFSLNNAPFIVIFPLIPFIFLAWATFAWLQVFRDSTAVVRWGNCCSVTFDPSLRSFLIRGVWWLFFPLKNQDVFQRQAGNSIKSNVFITFVPLWKQIKVHLNTFLLLTNTHAVHISFFFRWITLCCGRSVTCGVTMMTFRTHGTVYKKLQTGSLTTRRYCSLKPALDAGTILTWSVRCLSYVWPLSVPYLDQSLCPSFCALLSVRV